MSRKRMNKKGVAQILYVVLILLVSLVAGEIISLQNNVARVDFYRRSVRETSILDSINTMEFVKNFMKESVPLSFYKASADVLGSKYGTQAGGNGGFCCYDTACDVSESCKIPTKIGTTDVPTLKCQLWWRVYEKTYAPGLSLFIDYLENRTSKIYNAYINKSDESLDKVYMPDYCPMPPGNITVEDFSSENPLGKVRVNASSDIGEPIKYVDSNIEIKESNSFFSDKFADSVLELFKNARHEFVEDDWVKNQFDYGDKGKVPDDKLPSMPNKWCEMVGTNKEYCNMVATCSPTQADCWNGNCCCKRMSFGDMCEPLPDCETELSKYCSKGDTTKSDSCNFDRAMLNPFGTGLTGPEYSVTADEKYNCTMQERLGTSDTAKISQIEGKEWFEIRTKLDNCIKIAHETQQLEDQRFDADWKSWRDQTPESIQNCEIINSHSCGCEHQCFVGTTYEDSCGVCSNGYSEGTYSGRCPKGDPWIGRTLLCPDDCCGSFWTCDEWVDDCYGSNKYPCSTSDCPTGCCNPTTDPITGAITDCTAKACSAAMSPGKVSCNCGCSESWEHELTLSWRSNACGYPRCVQTYAFVTDVRCNFDYIGTANVTVDVKDIKNNYPVDSDWFKPEIPFYVTSGNTLRTDPSLRCLPTTTDDNPSTPQIENPDWQYCRCKSTATSDTTTTTIGTSSTTTTTIPSGFDFSISLNPASGSVRIGQKAQTTVTITLVSGSTQPVDNFIAFHLPTGSISSFSPTVCNPDCTSTLTIDTKGVNLGTYDIEVSATGGGKTKKAAYTLTVLPPSDVTCSVTSIDYCSGEYCDYAYISGTTTTVWYNPNVLPLHANTFTVNVNAQSSNPANDYMLSTVCLPATVSAGVCRDTSGDSGDIPLYTHNFDTAWTYNWDATSSYSGTATATAQDMWGNSGTCTFDVVNDAVAPMTTPTITGSYRIALACADNSGGSGCLHRYWCIVGQCPGDVGGSWNTYTGPISTVCTSCCSIKFYSIDNVNNAEKVQTSSYGPTC